MLREVFGHAAFRGEQAALVATVLGGRDALVLMPTGGGKSLCYQLPALMLGGTAIVVSPLIALMQDQVEALQALGVRAAFLNSSQDAGQSGAVVRQYVDGALDLLYVAPERLLSPGFSDLLRRGRPALFAVDEAHCVSEWGHDFRPEYLRLTEVLDQFRGVVRIALTATADEFTRAQIRSKLFSRPEEAALFVASFDRPNIRYKVELKDNEFPRILAYLQERSGESGIIYVRTRARTEQVAERLCKQGVQALAYHAGLSNEVRSAHLQEFLAKPGRVMCATIAFGMGIDKPDVRFVLHLDLPRSMESYYQETGRAGRDGKPALAWMFYSLGDVVNLRRLMDSSSGNADYRRVQEVRLNALLGFCESVSCRRITLLEYFGESRSEPCGNCDVCLEPPETYDGTVDAQKALSCVYRTGQRFGAGHLVDVLLGKSGERLRQLGHDTVSTFGIGMDGSAPKWRSVYRQLVARGYLRSDPEHGGLSLAAPSRAVLRGEQSVRLRKEAPPSRRSRAGSAGDVQLSEADEVLFEALATERRRLAADQNVPPYVVFHDRTLREMAQRRPRTPAELLAISGVGESKLQKYGSAFLAIVSGDQSTKLL